MEGRWHSRAFLLLAARLALLFSTGASRELLSGEDHHIYKGTIPRTLQLTPHPLLVGTRIVFIHIPKCSGASFQRDSAALMPVGVELKGNLEMTLPLTTKVRAGPALPPSLTAALLMLRMSSPPDAQALI